MIWTLPDRLSEAVYPKLDLPNLRFILSLSSATRHLYPTNFRRPSSHLCHHLDISARSYSENSGHCEQPWLVTRNLLRPVVFTLTMAPQVAILPMSTAISSRACRLNSQSQALNIWLPSTKPSGCK